MISDSRHRAAPEWMCCRLVLDRDPFAAGKSRLVSLFSPMRTAQATQGGASNRCGLVSMFRHRQGKCQRLHARDRQAHADASTELHDRYG